MKIEIEYEEVERLKEEKNKLHNEVIELKKQLSDLDEEKLKYKAVSIGIQEANAYLEAIFTKLGFDTSGSFYSPIKESLFDNRITRNEKWWEREDVTFELEAHVTENMKRAFINIGVITE